jgi:hypothetical protein
LILRYELLLFSPFPSCSYFFFFSFTAKFESAFLRTCFSDTCIS